MDSMAHQHPRSLAQDTFRTPRPASSLTYSREGLVLTGEGQESERRHCGLHRCKASCAKPAMSGGCLLTDILPWLKQSQYLQSKVEEHAVRKTFNTRRLCMIFLSL